MLHVVFSLLTCSGAFYCSAMYLSIIFSSYVNLYLLLCIKTVGYINITAPNT